MPAAPDRAPVAWRALGAIAAAYAVLLAAFSGGYGFHRDEFYFIAIGGQPAFGYDDQPPLVPLLAHAMDAVSGGSLVWLRLPSALAGGLIVLVTGLIAREFGATRAAQLFAAACIAVAAVLVAVSHLMSTTTYDLLAWTVLFWLVIRSLRDGGRSWLLVGLVAGVGLEIKTLLIFLLFALLVGVLVAGPREALRTRWLWFGAALALAFWLPNLWWQAAHHWPQLELSKAVARGDSGTSAPRLAFLPSQLVLVSPVLVPVWAAGWWRLARSAALRTFRCFPIAYVVLAVVFIVTGGKPYYLSGMFPVLLAAGATPVLTWAAHARRRRALLGVALGLSLTVSAVLFLPIVPAADLDGTPITAINYDAGETVGWPQFVRTVRDSYDSLPAAQQAHAIVLTANYGEAGSVLHSADPPPVYSGQNSMWELGPPSDATTTAVAIGYSETNLRRWFATVRRVATIDNGVGLDNDEQGEPVWVCTGPRRSWSVLWNDMRRLG